MVTKKFSLLKSFNTFNNDLKINKESTTSTNADSYDNNFSKKIDFHEDNFHNKYSPYPILDKDVITTVANNFPEPYDNIINALVSLKISIEKSIDYIEDASSSIIKKERNFELSTKYRETSMKLFEISNNINDYIEWMKNLTSKKEKNIIKENPINEEDNIDISSNLNIRKTELNICNDFTDKDPLSFKIDNNETKVDDWNDLVIKTADTLIKNYKKSKYYTNINIKFPVINSKKSKENDYRDTVIEMLTEYNIEPNRYFINIK
ncbi:hypothetical protein [Clostridium isatidis]|uniref:hypothetical protein n=1 Tax=Clostridium isatidis TaxID=182773 RepID=UPI003AAF11B0